MIIKVYCLPGTSCLFFPFLYCQFSSKCQLYLVRLAPYVTVNDEQVYKEPLLCFFALSIAASLLGNHIIPTEVSLRENYR